MVFFFLQLENKLLFKCDDWYRNRIIYAECGKLLHDFYKNPVSNSLFT